MLTGEVCDLVIVEPAGPGVEFVLDALEEFAGVADLPAVGEVAAVGQGQSHDGIAGLGEGTVGFHIGTGARVRLNIGAVCAEELFGAVDGEVFDLVGDLLAFIVAFARVAFGVFIGQAASGGFHHGLGDVVLRGDHADGGVLALLLLLDEVGDSGVGFGDGRKHGHILLNVILKSSAPIHRGRRKDDLRKGDADAGRLKKYKKALYHTAGLPTRDLFIAKQVSKQYYAV